MIYFLQRIFAPRLITSVVRMPFYAVAKGKETGVFKTWPECQAQTIGFKGAVFKKFDTLEGAEKFVQEKGGQIVDKRHTGEKQQLGDQTEDSKAKKRKTGEVESSSKKAKTNEASENMSRKNNFQVDSDGYLNVYTDGSCTFNGRQGAKAGIGVYFGPDNPQNVSEPVFGRATNNTAEIQAATRALEVAKNAGHDKVKLNTDSDFMIKAATSWMSNWKQNDWRKSDGGEVKNKEDFIKLDNASDGLCVKWEHVDAHCGIPENEAADQLAKHGAKRYNAPE